MNSHQFDVARDLLFAVRKLEIRFMSRGINQLMFSVNKQEILACLCSTFNDLLLNRSS